MPMGPSWFRGINWNLPNALMSNMPGFERATRSLFQATLNNHSVASIAELRDLAVEAEGKFVACQMTVDLFGYQQS